MPSSGECKTKKVLYSALRCPWQAAFFIVPEKFIVSGADFSNKPVVSQAHIFNGGHRQR
jgi:hypothetical protein